MDISLLGYEMLFLQLQIVGYLQFPHKKARKRGSVPDLSGQDNLLIETNYSS